MPTSKKDEGLPKWVWTERSDRTWHDVNDPFPAGPHKALFPAGPAYSVNDLDPDFIWWRLA